MSTNSSKKTLGLVHTSATLVPVFQELISTKLPHVDSFNIVDDSVIKDVIREGKLTPTTASRVVGHISAAAAAGADLVLATCSSIGQAVEIAAKLNSVPVLRVDQPMADQAVAMGKRIGVIATLSTTLEPTADLVHRRAALAGREIELTARLCDGAFAALMAGNTEDHDQRIAEALKELNKQVDVILLAQASMARVLDSLPSGAIQVPVLASPPSAVDHLSMVLNP